MESSHQVAERFHITYDGQRNNTFAVWKCDCLARDFIPGPRVLYYYNLRSSSGVIMTIAKSSDDTSIFNTTTTMVTNMIRDQYPNDQHG